MEGPFFFGWSHWTFNANLGERCCGNEEGKKNAGKWRGWKPGLWSSRGKFGETKTIIFRTTAYFELRTSGSCVIGGLKDSVVTSKSSTTEVKPLSYWDNWCWSVGAEKLAVDKKRLASPRWNLLGSVSSEAVFQKWPRFYLELAADLGSEKSHPGGTNFEHIKGSWRTGRVDTGMAQVREETWAQEKFFGENANQLQ